MHNKCMGLYGNLTQLISLKENGLYLFRILFEIGNFFLPLIACLIVIPICHNCLVKV